MCRIDCLVSGHLPRRRKFSDFVNIRVVEYHVRRGQVAYGQFAKISIIPDDVSHGLVKHNESFVKMGARIMARQNNAHFSFRFRVANINMAVWEMRMAISIRRTCLIHPNAGSVKLPRTKRSGDGANVPFPSSKNLTIAPMVTSWGL